MPPGRVTGFLGPNGAGKSTTMRMVLGLDQPTGGEALVQGKRYQQLPSAADRRSAAGREVGAPEPLSAGAPAVDGGVERDPESRVDEVLHLVGLTEVAGKNAGGFSLGMCQRLGLAAALLGDPQVLLFDEPVNGLDPEGIVWMRRFMQRLAAEGRTVFVSSHLLSEMAQTADHLVVIGRGRLMVDGPPSSSSTARRNRRCACAARNWIILRDVLTQQGMTVTRPATGAATDRLRRHHRHHRSTRRTAGRHIVRTRPAARVVGGGVHETDRGRDGVPRTGHGTGDGRGTLMGVLTAERIKFTSVKSPWWCSAVVVALALGFAALMGWVGKQAYADPNRRRVSRGLTPDVAIGGISGFGVMVLMILAALTVTSEYRFGIIRTTFQATPQRGNGR